MEILEVCILIIDWGDGNNSILEYMGIGYFDELELYWVQYGGYYIYIDNFGMLELFFQDSFLIFVVRNIE